MDRCGWDTASWVDQELAGSTFRDERLGRRLRKLLAQLADAVGAPIPLACQDWADTKAAYRFLSNEAVSEAGILAGHFHSTRGRVAATAGPILVLQDTTEFSYQRARPERIGALTTASSRREADGRLRMHTVCGPQMWVIARSEQRLLSSTSPDDCKRLQLVHGRIQTIQFVDDLVGGFGPAEGRGIVVVLREV